MSQKILLIKKQFLSEELAKESLDMAFAGASLDLKISLLFMEDAVFHLCKSDNSRSKALFEALPFYDIQTIYVINESLRQRNLTADDLVIPVICIAWADVSHVLSQYERIVS